MTPPSPESYNETFELTVQPPIKLWTNQDLCPQCGQIKNKTSRICRKCLLANVKARNNGVEKLCTRCNNWFSFEKFGVNNSRRDGLNYWCSKCSAEVSREKHRVKSEKEYDLGMRVCETCNLPKPRTDFAKKAKGIRRICKDCVIRDNTSITHKRCSRCKLILPVSDFYKASKYADGLSSSCKECAAKIVRENKGLPKGWYEERLVIQNNKCIVCSASLIKGSIEDRNSCHVDHDHKCCPPTKYCGKCARGLLCGSCNRRIGFVEDNAWFKEALAYLHRFGAMTELQWVDKT